MKVLQILKSHPEILLVLIVMLILVGALKKIGHLQIELEENESLLKERIVASNNLKYEINELRNNFNDTIALLNHQINGLKETLSKKQNTAIGFGNTTISNSPQDTPEIAQEYSESKYTIKELKYIIGKRKELLELQVIKKDKSPFKYQKAFFYNTPHQTTHYNQKCKEIVLTDDIIRKAFRITPELEGAILKKENGKLILEITDFSKLSHIEHIVVYYYQLP